MCVCVLRVCLVVLGGGLNQRTVGTVCLPSSESTIINHVSEGRKKKKWIQKIVEFKKGRKINIFDGEEKERKNKTLATASRH